jgi:CubicO group peptidase (beta-lactamase class C family)
VKVALDDDIRQYLHEMPDFGKTITVRHLIYHFSGLRDWVGMLPVAGWRLDDVITLQDILRMVQHQQELNFDPGEEGVYSNTGYNLLAQIVAPVTGHSFRQWTEEHIFKQLGMSSTHVHDDHEMVVQNLAYSYAPVVGGTFKKLSSNLTAVGSSSLFTTVADLAKWITNFEDGRVGGHTVIERMHTPGRLNNGTSVNYAYGLSLREYKGLKIVAHDGEWAGYRATLLRVPAQRFAVAILSNNAATDPHSLALQVVEVCLADQLPSAPSQAGETPVQAVEIDPATYDAYVGKYLLKKSVSTWVHISCN